MSQRTPKQKRAAQKAERAVIQFQPDAVELEHQPVPLGARWTLYAVIGFLLAFVAWAWWAQVDQIVTAQGKLLASQPPIEVRSSQMAPLQSINVKVGDEIKAGQVLATLDPTFSNADLEQLESDKNGFEAAIERLTAEQDGTEFVAGDRGDAWQGQQTVFAQRRDEFEANQRKFESSERRVAIKQKNNKAEIQQNEKRVSMFEDLEDRTARLAAESDTDPSVDLLSRQLQTADARMQLSALVSKQKELAAELIELQRQQAAFVATWKAEVATNLLNSQQDLASTEQGLVQARKLSKLIELKIDPAESEYKEFIVSKVAERSVGSVLKKGDTMFELQPLNAPLEAEVEINGRDIAKIKTLDVAPESDEKFPNGTRVTVKLEAFPFQKHGTLTGFVKTISDDVVQRPTPAGVTTMFRGRVEMLAPIKLNNVDKDFRLRPGMTVCWKRHRTACAIPLTMHSNMGSAQNQLSITLDFENGVS